MPPVEPVAHYLAYFWGGFTMVVAIGLFAAGMLVAVAVVVLVLFGGATIVQHAAVHHFVCERHHRGGPDDDDEFVDGPGPSGGKVVDDKVVDRLLEQVRHGSR